MQLVLNLTGASQSSQVPKEEKKVSIREIKQEFNKEKVLKEMDKKLSKSTPKIDDLRTIDDFQRAARNLLSKQIFTFFSSGSEDQISLQDNINAFKRIKFLPRVLVNVSNINTKIYLLNGRHEINFPVMIAPWSLQGLVHEHGEKATVRASVSIGTITTISTFSTTTMEDIINQDIVHENNSPLWYQLYVMRDRDFTTKLIKRAEKCGYKALVITVDHPVMGNREAQLRDKVTMPVNIKLSNLLASMKDISNDNFIHPTYFGNLIDPTVTWEDIEWFRSVTDLPLIAKGIMTPEDAILAYEKGFSGIIVSNHGARQLDHSMSTIDALPAITQALQKLNSPIDIYIDGGIRHGSDIVKALCLGAKAVLVGRPIIYGLAMNGEEGVKKVLTILKQELESTMKLCGISDIKDCNESYVLLSGQTMLEKTGKILSKL
jgi:isopentenyl diphosphate isomerase/L-lactate dehydrogenase-like FMN-dependent dehydrogenase